MGIREEIANRKKHQIQSVKIDCALCDEVSIRRLNTGAMLEIAKTGDDEAGLAMVQKAVVDEQGEVVFESLDAVRDLDWELTQKLIAACTQVNGLQTKIESALGN